MTLAPSLKMAAAFSFTGRFSFCKEVGESSCIASDAVMGSYASYAHTPYAHTPYAVPMSEPCHYTRTIALHQNNVISYQKPCFSQVEPLSCMPRVMYLCHVILLPPGYQNCAHPYQNHVTHTKPERYTALHGPCIGPVSVLYICLPNPTTIRFHFICLFKFLKWNIDLQTVHPFYGIHKHTLTHVHV